MPLDKIKQTSKTILFEEFSAEASEGMDENDVCPDLATILKGENSSDYVMKVAEQLEVKSFDEFVKKFTPCVWETMRMTEGESTPQFCYSIEKPQGYPNAKKIQLSTHEFYKMVMNLYSKKINSGDDNLDFDYSMVEELLSPAKALKDAKKIRKELQYNYTEYLKLPDSRKSEKNDKAKKITETRKAIAGKYDNISALLKLSLGDVEEKLLALPEGNKKVGDGVELLVEPVSRPCLMEFSETGDIDVVYLEDIPENEQKEKNDVTKKIAGLVGKDYDQKEGANANDFVRSLVLSNFAGGDQAGALVPTRAELVEKREMYTYMYKNHQEQFVKTISSVVEKMLNVKVFFDNATVGGELTSTLVVANCKASDLLDGDDIKGKFTTYLEKVSNDNTFHKVWFAIVPSVGDSDLLDDDDEEFDIDADIYGNEGESSSEKAELLSLSAGKEMITLLSKHKIMSFFNFKACEKTSFYHLDKKIITTYQDKVESLNGNEYATFCYPNFTILPRRETNIKIGITEKNGYQEDEFLEIPGIYVDASYVAAGLTVGVQNPAYLKQKGYKVNAKNPGVRFNLEEGNNPYMVTTTMNREGNTPWSADVEAFVKAEKFGFCFCGNTKYFNNQLVNNSYVYLSRNMKKDCIYKTIIKEFVTQYLRLIAGKGGFDTASTLVNNEGNQWSLEGEGSPDLGNCILRKDEKITIDKASGKLKISLKEKDEYTDISVEIDDN